MIDLLQTSLKYYGVSEVDGDQANTNILNWIKLFFPKAKDDSDYAWCSIFINNMAKLCNYETTNSAMARSWLNIGYESEHPEPGDIVVFWRIREDSRWGHVGIYINETENYIRCLGGNQKNEVNIIKIPKYRLLSIRKLNKVYDEK